MTNFLNNNRSSGILAHITSLPSTFGVGDIGYSSFEFLEYLTKANQTYWQFLPTSPTNSVFDYSPYMSTSAFAGSTMLICPRSLVEDNLIREGLIQAKPDFSPYIAEFNKVYPFKQQLLLEAFNNFNPDDFPDYKSFIQNSPWLMDYVTFMALKKAHKNSGWFTWPEQYRIKDNQTIAQFQIEHQEDISYFIFEQFIFFRQWQKLKSKAEEQNIKLFGDIPIYVGLDSADVWANQTIFTLSKETCLPETVAGVPPDYFSETGQRWGNPLYVWDTKNDQTYQQLTNWWCERFRHIFTMVDVARIDHFRGFESYWSIPEENKTAVNGEWLKGPGTTFFDTVFKKLGPLNIVAEDLGIITEDVEKLRDDLGFPGMKVLQFAFDGNENNSFLPHNYTSTNSIIYTGTHDNDTTVGWYLSDQLDDEKRDFIKQYTNRNFMDGSSIHHDFIHLAQASVSALSIFPLQDILGFGNDCKMNSPGIPEGNWRWRCAPEFLTEETANWLSNKTEMFGRGRKNRPQNTNDLK